MIELALILMILCTFFVMEGVFYKIHAQGSLRLTLDWRRFNTEFVFLYIVIVLALFFGAFFEIFVGVLIFYITAACLLYVMVSEYTLYGKDFHLKWSRNNGKIAFIAILATLTLFIICYTTYILSIPASLRSAAIFSAANWFSEIINNLVTDPQMQMFLTLMAIGSLTILIGQARNSDSSRAAGYFLVLFLPIASILDTVMTKMDQISEIAPTLYGAFLNEGICIFIYTIVLTAFYLLLTSIIFTFVSMARPFSDED